MKNKSAKKLRRLAEHIGVGKTKAEVKKLYKKLKSVHKSNNKEL